MSIFVFIPESSGSVIFFGGGGKSNQEAAPICALMMITKCSFFLLLGWTRLHVLWAMSWLLCTALSVLCFHFNHDDFRKVLFKQVSTSGWQGVCSLQFILTVPHCNKKMSLK